MCKELVIIMIIIIIIIIIIYTIIVIPWGDKPKTVRMSHSTPYFKSTYKKLRVELSCSLYRGDVLGIPTILQPVLIFLTGILLI